MTEKEDVEGELTIAFSFENAVKCFESPKDVFDSLEWAEYVGIVSEKDPHVVNGFRTKRDIRLDFFTDAQDNKLDTLSKAKDEMGFETERYLYVGGSKRDEVIAEKAGWEYTDVEDAADKTGWKVKPDR